MKKNRWIKSLSLLMAIVLVTSQLKISLKAEESTIEEKVEEEENLEEIIELESENVESNIDQPYLGAAHSTVIASDDTLEIGRTAQYQIYINMDGRKNVYKDVNIAVALPQALNNQSILFNQDLNDLKIRGVAPQYNVDEKTLNYYFSELEGGFEASVLLNIETVNGYALNGEQLRVEASISTDDILLSKDDDLITLIANQNISLSNKLSGIIVDDELENRLSIKYKDEAIFTVGSSVNKFQSGSLNLKEDSKVIITYTLAEGLVYVSDTSGNSVSQSGQTLTWEFDSNLNEDDDYFYTKNFDVLVKVEGDLTVFSKVTNTATVTVTYVDGSTQSYSANATVLVSPNFEFELETQYNGSAYASIFSGPSDGLGNTGWINNDDPEVTDGGLLGWNLYLTPMGSINPNVGLNAYNVFFHPDENINIRNMYSGDFYYRPSSAFAQAGLQPLEEKVYASVSIKYKDSDTWYKGFDRIEPRTYYSAKELGIEANRKVETIWFHFHDGETHVFWEDIGFGNTEDNSIFTIPAGMTTTTMRIWTTIDEGYVGSIESKAALAYSGWNITGNRVDVQSKDVPEELKVSHFQSMTSIFESRLLGKTAQVVKPPVGIERFVRSNAYFTKTNNNLLKTGENELKLEIINDSASVSALKGPFETYVIIDEGITFGDLSEVVGADVTLVTDNYKNTGKTLLKVTFLSTNITISQKTTVSIPVIVTENVPYNVSVEIYGYLNESFEVSDVSNTNGTFTMKESDIADFNGNDIEEEMFVTRNQYTYIDAYEFYGTLNASNSRDKTINTIDVYDDSLNTMHIGIHNPELKPISTMVLIGVLPSEGDTYVLNDENRESKFSVALKEAIELTEEQKDHFEIFYSTSKEPLVEGVLDLNTSSDLPGIVSPQNVDNQPWLSQDEVTNYKDIKSYKIVQKKDSKSLRDEHIIFNVPIEIQKNKLTGKEPIEDRIAHTSFAVGINNASVFEVQTLNMIYNAKPQFKIKADDVTLRLSDVDELINKGELEQFVKEKALPMVSQDGQWLVNPQIVMEILNKPEVFKVGEYDLEFMFDSNLENVGLIKVTTKLFVIADDEVELENPSAPQNPEDIEVENANTDVETGIMEDQNYYIIVMTIALFILLSTKLYRKNN